MAETWIILGASSAMARALATALARRGAALVLAGRDRADLEATASHLRMLGATRTGVVEFDARRPETFQSVLEAAGTGVVNAAVFVGTMPDQSAIDTDPSLVDGTLTDNLAGPIRFLQMLAPVIEGNRAGCVVGIGSVAGDRGRIGNYVYGAAKAGFHTYLSGLRNRLTRSGGHVVTVKPGFVDTAMTWGIPGMFLVAPPEAVARAILKAADTRRDVIYTPFFWRWIMLIIRAIPERVFKKMSI